MKSYFSANEAAKFLRVARSTIIRRVRRGLIPGAKKYNGERDWHIPLSAIKRS